MTQPVQTICRSCGFAAHKPEDLVDGQCPRWSPGDETLTEPVRAFYGWFHGLTNAGSYVLLDEYRKAFFAGWIARDERSL